MTRFSERYGLRPRSGGLVYDQISRFVRGRYVEIWDDLWTKFPGLGGSSRFFGQRWDELYKVCCKVTHRLREPAPFSYHAGIITPIINRCEWFEFLDIVEESYRWLDDETAKSVYETAINELFRDENIGRKLENGRVERISSEPTRQQIEQARTMLQDPRFLGPDQQFAKAIEHFSKRPDPDEENCIKDAVGAMEGAARIISGKEKELLPQILDTEPFRSEIHGALRKAIDRVCGFRGDVPGVAHGQTGPSKVGIEEAEWVLGFCASTIIYLVKKFTKN